MLRQDWRHWGHTSSASPPVATISKAEKFFKNGTMAYELALKGAKVGEATLTPDGKWVSPK